MINYSYSQTTLPKRAKLKTIIYSDYTISGYVYKKQFVEDQKLTFLATTNSYNTNDTILSGRYFYADDGNSYIDGIRINSSFHINSRTKGIFKVTNTKNELGITANKKEGHNLVILLDSLTYYKDSRYYYNNTYDYGTLILQKLPNNKFNLKITYKDLTLETNIPFELDEGINYHSLNNYIKKSREVKLSFKNGDIFIGTVKNASKLYGCDYYKAPYAPDKGEYRYATGEVSTGIFECNNYFNRFYLKEGVTVFADGSTCNGDWLFQSNLTLSEQERIYRNGKSPTEMRNMAKKIIEEKERKLLEKELAEKKAEQERLQKQIVRRKKLISKYGEYYGKLISEGKIVDGMSQEMVNEMFKKEYFDISTIVRNNQMTKIWRFSKEKMQLEIMKEGAKSKHKEGALALILMMNFTEKMGGLDIPQMLIFTNDKLTDIYK